MYIFALMDVLPHRLICHVQEIYIFNDFKETRKLWVEIDGYD